MTDELVSDMKSAKVVELDRERLDHQKIHDERTHKLHERQGRAAYSSAFFGVVLAAIFTAMGAIFVANKSGDENRALEVRREEAARILEIVKVGVDHPGQAITNLKFLSDIGLITDRNTRMLVDKYIAEHTQTSQARPVPSVSLPAPVPSNVLTITPQPTLAASNLDDLISALNSSSEAAQSSILEDFAKNYTGRKLTVDEASDLISAASRGGGAHRTAVSVAVQLLPHPISAELLTSLLSGTSDADFWLVMESVAPCVDPKSLTPNSRSELFTSRASPFVASVESDVNTKLERGWPKLCNR